MTSATKASNRTAADKRTAHGGTDFGAARTGASPRTRLARTAAAAEELPFAALFYWVD